MKKYEMGVIGLGVMGLNLALNIEDHGFPVAVWNRHYDKAKAFLAAHGDKQFAGAEKLEDFVALLAPPRRILVMVKAGNAVDQMIAQLVPLLDRGDIIIDGGNSYFKDTIRRDEELRAQGFRYLGLGVSGGEEGARFGPSLMPGGAREAYQAMREILEAIAAKSDSGPCVTYLGPDGAGHFVKLIHNAIEYGIMQLLAESYDILRRALGLEASAMAKLYAGWNSGPMESFLMELTAKVLTVADAETGRPLIDLVLDSAGQKGTGRWSGQEALDLGVPVPTIMAALFARNISAMKAERVQAAGIIAGPSLTAYQGDRDALIDGVGKALTAAIVCAYAEGLHLIGVASKEYGWKLDLAEAARIWKGGCIIRSGLLDLIMQAYAGQRELVNLLLDDRCRGLVEPAQPGWRRVVATAAELGIPVPAMAASLAYFDSYRTADLPQNLTQAQRDGFGAHTYRRTDRPEAEPVHTDWLGLAKL